MERSTFPTPIFLSSHDIPTFQYSSSMASLFSRDSLKCAVLFLRLGSGGAFAGFFLGTLFFGIGLVVANFGNRLLGLGIGDVLIGGVVSGAAGAVWGLKTAFGELRNFEFSDPAEPEFFENPSNPLP